MVVVSYLSKYLGVFMKNLVIYIQSSIFNGDGTRAMFDCDR